MEYLFEWDPTKAKINLGKHKVAFERAATVFLDPEALSVYDVEHSASEDRWVTLGVSSTGPLLVVNHTFLTQAEDRSVIRIISARRATRRENRQYRERTYEG